MSAVGTPLHRVEDVALLLGGGCYVADINRPNQAYARIVRSAIAHGRLGQIHTDEARRCDGVVAVVTASDIPGIVRLKIPMRGPSDPRAEKALQTPLAVDRVRYVGEPIAVVVAVDAYVAEDAAEQVWAEIEELEPFLDLTVTRPSVLHEGLPNNVAAVFDFRHGEDVEDLFASADVVLREGFSSHRHSAAPMETRGLVAELDPETERLTVWGPTKVKHFNKRTLAELLGMPPGQIRFVEPDVGGGFGPRGEFYPEDFLVPWLALTLRRPIKWIEDRMENLVALNHSREHVFEIEMAATADGTLLAFRGTNRCSLGAYVRTNGFKVPECAAMHLAGPYAWRGFRSTALAVLTNKTPVGTYRGPGEVEATFARERMLDLLAARIGIDPDELRRRNLIPVDWLPHRLVLGHGNSPIVYDSGDYREMFAILLEHAGYERLKADRDRRRGSGEMVGIGLACCFNEGGYGPFEAARLIAEPDGTFTAHVGVAGVGQGVRTALAQVLADALGVDVGHVVVFHHDTDEITDGVGAFADRTAAMGGSAVVDAVTKLRESARRRAAEHFGVEPEDVTVEGGGLRAADGRTVSMGDLGCDVTGRFEKDTADFSFCTSLALVSIDSGTGKVTVERYVGVYDVGRAINPLIVKGQLDGAVAQGIGGALLEEFTYDEYGQPLATSFMDYLLPSLSELPTVESIWVEYPTTENLVGAKGAGGLGIIGTHGALANAVADALESDSASVTRLPLSPNNVWELLSGRGEGAPR